VKTYIIKKLSEVDKSQLFDFYKKVYNNVDKSFIENIKRLNIIYTNFKNSEKNIFETVVK
jgi:hypothetical protein|tara:strand:- start:118 stop:297 length:180 start_codon:yes stop_codon:yes gene_type:complete